VDSNVQPPIKDLLLGALRQFDLVSSLDAGRLRGFLATSSGASRLLRVSSASLGRGRRLLSTRPRRKTRISSQHLRACRYPVARRRSSGRRQAS